MDQERRKAKLRQRFRAMIIWIDEYVATTNDPRDIAFGKSLRRYAVQNLELLASARTRRDFRELERRALKADDAAVSYVLEHFDPDMM